MKKKVGIAAIKIGRPGTYYLLLFLSTVCFPLYLLYLTFMHVMVHSPSCNGPFYPLDTEPYLSCLGPTQKFTDIALVYGLHPQTHARTTYYGAPD